MKHILLYLILLISSSSYATNAGTIKTVENDIDLLSDTLGFVNADGESKYFTDYDGKKLLVIFWATWCVSCAHEIVELDKMQKRLQKYAFEILPISQDFLGAKAIASFYKQHNIQNLPILHDPQNRLFRSLGIASVPTAYLVSSNGSVLYSFSGNIDWSSDQVLDIIEGQLE